MTFNFSKIEVEALLNALYTMRGQDLPDGDLLRASVRAERKLVGAPKNAETPLATHARAVTLKRESGEWPRPQQ